MKISVIIPCLNEKDTVGICVEKALIAIKALNVRGEVIVSDNGSNDGSQAIALEAGAIVVIESRQGYGNALMRGIAESQGKYVIMGDADSSYDFSTLPKFLMKLEEGFDLVLGCRLHSGGGKIEAGAMPFLHKYFGNPLFSKLVRVMFKAPINDVNCGLRAIRKDHYNTISQKCSGMEFAVEMVIKSALVGARIAEIPITLYPDGRKNRKPHLRTFRDGWRTLVYFLISSPRWLFLFPGIALFIFGTTFFSLGLFRIHVNSIVFDVNTLIIGSICIISSYQLICFAFASSIYGMVTGIIPFDDKYKNNFNYFSLEKGLALGVLSLLVGACLFLGLFLKWSESSFGSLNQFYTNRISLIAMTLSTLGIQTIFSSFFLCILGFRFSDPTENKNL